MIDRLPLPSWNDGAAKSAILDFVARVTKERGPRFAPQQSCIATFDNDGTLSASSSRFRLSSFLAL
jgi:hypothetical protein